MEQYIPKSALMAEIEKLMGNPELIEDWRYRVKMEEKNELLKSIINTIDTLEVKEVNLKEKLDEWMKYGPHTDYPWCTIPDAIKITAEHFFELGIKAQKGE